MNITIREEAGYDLALYGMSLSFKDRAIKPEDWWDFTPKSSRIVPGFAERRPKMKSVCTQNANRGMGHNKFRRQIVLWIDIEAPRFWWSEFDTYKVGTVAQSESTMHTLKRRDVIEDDFEAMPFNVRGAIDSLNLRRGSDIETVKGLLPESYLQRRLVTLNYEVLATIINQRAKHKLPQWRAFIEAIYKQVEHVELLPDYPYHELSGQTGAKGVS